MRSVVVAAAVGVLLLSAPAYAGEMPALVKRGQDGSLVFRADAPDPYGTITLDNRTRGSRPPLKRPAINWWASGKWKWQMGFDVGGRDDFALLYRRDPVAPRESRDVIYVTNERLPRVGILANNGAASLTVNTATPGRPALDLHRSYGDGWLARFYNGKDRGRMVGGVFSDGMFDVGKLHVRGFEPATTPGRVIGKYPLHDGNANVVGWVPVYDEIR